MEGILKALQIANEIYRKGEVEDQSGNVYKLHSEMPGDCTNKILEVISGDKNIIKTMEIGCAYGLSSLHICDALKERKNASHLIIDPFQNSDWNGIGVNNLNIAGITFFNLIEELSEITLPRLVEDGKGTYDFILVDGMHTFDHTLLDLFYATTLVRVGGYVAIDDCEWESVGRAVHYISNYPCYKIVATSGFGQTASTKKKIKKKIKKSLAKVLSLLLSKKSWERLLHPSLYKKLFITKFPRMVILKKISEDNRKWDWHNDNF